MACQPLLSCFKFISFKQKFGDPKSEAILVTATSLLKEDHKLNLKINKISLQRLYCYKVLNYTQICVESLLLIQFFW
jgi:hypothetical protein